MAQSMKMRGMTYERDGGCIPSDKITPLRQWSDLVFLTLKKTMEDIGAGSLNGVNHIFRHNIVNDEVRAKLAMITGRSSIHDLPGTVWTPLNNFFTEKTH